MLKEQQFMLIKLKQKWAKKLKFKSFLEKENVQCVRFLHPNGSLLFCFSPQLGYPSRPPLALLCFPALAASVRRAFTKLIYSEYETRCEGVLYEIVTDLDELVSKARESATEEVKHTTIRREKPVHSPPKPVESKPRHPRNRVLDKSILFGSPSARVSEQRASLPITNYKAKVLDMIEHNQVSIVSGGNIDVTSLSRVIDRGLLNSGRSASLLIELIDKPGQLKDISRIIADCGGNVTGVHYEKGNTESINGCYLRIEMETRDYQHVHLITRSLRDEGFKIVQVLKGVKSYEQ